MRCPSCHGEIHYSWLSGMAGPNLHFYAKENNDVIVRSAWFSDIQAFVHKGAPDLSVLTEIDTLLSSVPDGAKYSVWNNVKCPHCNFEFPYRFRENLRFRLEDPTVVLVDGCSLDTEEGVFVVEVDLSSSPPGTGPKT